MHVPQKVGMAPIMRDVVEYELTTVFDLNMHHQAQTSKDRTNLFGDKIFTITEETGTQIIQWLNENDDLQGTEFANSRNWNGAERPVNTHKASLDIRGAQFFILRTLKSASLVQYSLLQVLLHLNYPCLCSS